VERARGRIEQRPGVKPLREPLQLARRDATLAEIDVVDDDPTLAEESQGGTGGSRIVPPEDLDLGHLAGRRLAERGGHAAQPSARVGPAAPSVAGVPSPDSQEVSG
jgi:hypothetical protein